MSPRRFAGVVAAVTVVGLLAGLGLERLRGQPAEAAEAAPAAAEHYEIEAKSYLLVSKDGHTRASLSVVHGGAHFAMMDEAGTERIVFATDAVGSPYLGVGYPDGKPAVEVMQPARDIRIPEDTEVRIVKGQRPPNQPAVEPGSPLARLLAKINVRDRQGGLKWTTDQFLSNP